MTHAHRWFFKSLKNIVGIAKMDGDFDKVFSVGGDGVNQFSTSWNTYAYRCGLPIQTENLPRNVTLKGRKRNLGDVFHIGLAQVVSPEFRAFVEGLEPGVHQFEPVTLSWKDKSIAGEWFWFVPCRRVRTLKEDMLNPPLRPSGIWLPIHPETKEHVPYGTERIVFDSSKIGDLLIWCDPGLPGEIYGSDAFVTAYEASGLSGLATGKMETV